MPHLGTEREGGREREREGAVFEFLGTLHGRSGHLSTVLLERQRNGQRDSNHVGNQINSCGSFRPLSMPIYPSRPDSSSFSMQN